MSSQLGLELINFKTDWGLSLVQLKLADMLINVVDKDKIFMEDISRSNEYR